MSVKIRYFTWTLGKTVYVDSVCPFDVVIVKDILVRPKLGVINKINPSIINRL